MSQFDDIRPYNDDEVKPTIQRLLRDDEMISAVSKLIFPKLSKYVDWLLKPFVRFFLRRQIGGIDSVDAVQLKVQPYLQSVVDRTSTAFTYSGLEKLDRNRPYLFVSNHRDIAMDPALVNLVLHNNQFNTVRIAIGDNLLTKPFVTDLIRVNKSFIVNRSATRPREKLKALKHLSAYIHHSICEENSNIWIAHREGRAKDGLDITNSAIIGMFALSRPKSVPFADYVKELNIVPVTISYEWDPCDGDKAVELDNVAKHGSHEKAENEDIASIGKGISGNKGAVHIAFGEPLTDDYENADEVADEISRQIHSNYVLHPSNLMAYYHRYGKTSELGFGVENKPFDPQQAVAIERELDSRLSGLTADQKTILFDMYANPVISKEKQQSSN